MAATLVRTFLKASYNLEDTTFCHGRVSGVNPVCGVRRSFACCSEFPEEEPGSLTRPGFSYNHLVMERAGHVAQSRDLDAVFGALADPTRRAILSRLAAGEASVNEIAAPFEISQPAVSKHLKVLEQAGLIERRADRQRRPARLKAGPMEAAARWLKEFKQT